MEEGKIDWMKRRKMMKEIKIFYVLYFVFCSTLFGFLLGLFVDAKARPERPQTGVGLFL
jgi:hypothetical protein